MRLSKLRTVLAALTLTAVAVAQVPATVPGSKALAESPGLVLVLEELVCKSTEDSTGADEAKLVLRVDGVSTNTWRRDMNDGQSLRLDASYRIQRKASLQLFDLDSGLFDSDDDLGTIEIDAKEAARTTSWFRKDGASYSLVWLVRSAGMPAAAPSAENPAVEDGLRLVVHMIRCRKQEDILGNDDVELRPVVDRGRQSAVRKEMSKGDAWQVGLSLAFKDEVRLQLFELDNDPDDHLGSIRVTARTPRGRRTLVLDRDDARYDVEVELVGSAGVLEAPGHAALEHFRRSSKSSGWSKLAKEKILVQLEDRLLAPTIMDQAGAPLCGPMAVLVALAQAYPDRYVAMAKGIFERGRFRWGGLTVDPDDHLAAAPARLGVPELDWMLAASMRDDANWLLDYEGTDTLADDIAGITTPAEVEDWFRALLDCKTEHLPTRAFGELAAMRRARNALAAGNVVALFVDSDHMPTQAPHPLFDQNLTENHVVLLQGVTTVGVRTRFKVFSWGRVYDIDMRKQELEDLLMGVVIGYF